MKFIFGREILDPSEFYDREEELKVLINSFKVRQPIAVIGYRRMGKSSLINVALKLMDNEDTVTVKVSLEGVRSIRQFLDLYVSSILTETVRKSIRLKLKVDLINIRDALHALLGAVREAGVRFNGLDFYVRLYTDVIDYKVNMIKALDEFLQMPQKIAEELGKNMVIALDEFQQVRFLKQPYPDVLRVMRRIWQSHSMVEYVIAGSEVGIMRELLSRSDQPFFAFFRVIELKPFNKDTSISFLREGLMENGVYCVGEVLEKAYELTGGFPAWLNLAGLRMVEGGCDKWFILNDPTVKLIIESELSSLNHNQLRLLKALAMGIRLNKANVMKPNRVLNELIAKGLVEKTGWGRYRIVDPLLANYLKING
ncbi:AAA family ATPase [Caldivirga maquilingensis]|uniref:ATPase n=1 Tax=Caldivirga maquilingensis (strain ATCC 700844 / DSM 13496 / JCM 10307 / IC-167) TaxID=397948 RepID=A8MA94_CALMQ|nr:ATP-binding protein [Caldivirga maquilingensis]ABW01026.1 ATPase [Caldivirga maquilingensis IC-167]